MHKRPSSAHVFLRYEHIDKGKFTPTHYQVGTTNEDANYLEARAADLINTVHTRDDRRNPHLVVKLTIEVPVDSIADARWMAEQEWTPTAEREVEATLAHIPGKMYATYKDGQIDRVWFSPAAAHPGYRDASFFVEQGPDAEEGDDRPFWHAMEAYLAVNDPGWEG